MYDTAGIRGIVACVVHQGVNASIFAYGCTGSGKSHTMQGGGVGSPSEEGIVPRALRQVLAAAAEAEEEEGDGGGSCRVLISIFEIYQEKLRDLLVFDDAGAAAGAGGGAGVKRKQSFGSSSSSGRSGFLFGGSNGAQQQHHQRASFAPNVDRGGGIGARNSADLPVREDTKGNIIVPGLNETEVKVRACVYGLGPVARYSRKKAARFKGR